MGLSSFNTFIRYLLFLICLSALGFDVHFIVIYNQNQQVVFSRKFYTESGLVLLVFLIVLLSEVSYRIIQCNRRRLLRSRQRKSSHYPGTLSAHPDNIDDQYQDNYANGIHEHHSNHNHHRPSGCTVFWSVLRTLIVWAICVGILSDAIPTFRYQERFVFTIPFSRDSLSGQEWDERYDPYEPHDLFNCPEIQPENMLTALCLYDQITVILAAVVAVMAAVEAVATVILMNRTYVLGDQFGLEEDEKRRSTMQKRADIYGGGAATHNAAVPTTIVPTMADIDTTSVVESQVIEMLPYETETETLHHQHVSSDHDRPPPPLPPRSIDDGSGTHEPKEDIYTLTTVSPFANSFEEKDSKKYLAMTSSDNRDSIENEAGPSHSVYPIDVKHQDGS